MNNKALRYFIIGTFVTLYLMVSVISTIHVIDFFRMSNPNWLAVSLAIAFEVGAAASLASIIALEKMNRTLIWALFITLTFMQMMGNTYYAYTNLEDFQSWVELFGLVDSEPIVQKRILALVSGAILPLVALGFIKSLVDYIRPEEKKPVESTPAVYEAAWIANPPHDNDEELERASLEDLQEFFNEEEKQEVIEEFTGESNEESVLEALKNSGELTDQDIENYREKSRIPPRGSANKQAESNPHLIPGIRT
jgi:hypothetical protein